MKDKYISCLNVVNTTVVSSWRYNRLWGLISIVLFSSVLLGACEVYDGALIADQKGEIRESPQPSTLEDSNEGYKTKVSIGGYAALSVEEEQTQSPVAIREFGMFCVFNPDDDGTCPWICAEVCDNQDNDCDGETDEAEANAACELDNALAECSQGACVVKNCVNGFDDCDEDDSNGCETPLNTMSDCGSCGNACAGISCQSGRCSELECDADTADCDGETENGCETTLGTNTDCGLCGNECPKLPDADFPNALTAGCFEYGCRISKCEHGYQDCNAIYNDGCETDVANDDNNCGECGLSCRALPNVLNATCQDGVCVIDSCQDGYLDDNESVSDGCETDDANPMSPEPGCKFETHGNHIYYFCEATRTWNEAYESCSNAGLYLVRIDDVAENTFINSSISEDRWIGASDSENEGVWVWTVNNQRFWPTITDNRDKDRRDRFFVNWTEGEPNNYNDSDCAGISASENGRWKDIECDSLYGYVCEGDDQYEPCINPGFCETSIGATRGADGVCQYPANQGGGCNDDDPCTHTDRCQADKSCAGTVYTCDNPGFCEATEGATCNGNGTCTYPAAQDGRCDDDNPCTHTDRCQADKSCIGTPYTCDSPGLCETAEDATCNGDGTCTYSANVGEVCDDENQCTYDDQCQEDRSCKGKTDAGADCDDENACTVDDVCDESASCTGTESESCIDDTGQGDGEGTGDEPQVDVSL